jgi:hypothetical protein
LHRDTAIATSAYDGCRETSWQQREYEDHPQAGYHRHVVGEQRVARFRTTFTLNAAEALDWRSGGYALASVLDESGAVLARTLSSKHSAN